MIFPLRKNKYILGSTVKKTIYYVCPFIIIPCLCLLCEFLNKRDVLEIYPYFFLAILFIISAMIANFTPTQKNFDFIITAILPLSMFFTMFIGGFIDETDLGGRFYMYRAFEVAFKPFALIEYLIIAVLAFISSFKLFRISRIIIKIKTRHQKI